MYPVKNILRPNDYRKFLWSGTHTGTDDKVELGEPVYAVSRGVVVFSTRLMNGYGGYDKHNPDNKIKGGVVWISHESKKGEMFLVQYGHVSSDLKVGDIVDKGDLIGQVHSYFYTDGEGKTTDLTHLHLSVNTGDNLPVGGWGYVSNPVGLKYVEPVKFLEENT